MIIETERLILRDFVPEDWAAILAYQSDPRYLRYYAWTDRTEEEVRAFLQIFLERQQAHPRLKFQLAITLRENGQLIGNCGIRKDYAEARVADIGYELAPDYWGQGYATEAAGAIIAFGFEELKLHRIWADCVAENVASARVLEKLGMRLEGRLRENQCFKGRRWDTLIYGLLITEWQA